jgi:hypothetical protein
MIDVEAYDVYDVRSRDVDAKAEISDDDDERAC